ncbi:M20/M25/M40 family metallo-hydrolase [Actinomadura nitritigenes]|uniref:M20/M25/M40 family metallo-hydrolase n=1 Tax=Actinomadura nitritigenes TaxID=134602 RepID=UPI003D8DA02B
MAGELRAAHAAVHETIERDEEACVEEIRRYLRIPGFSASGEGIEGSALATLAYLREIGATDARLIDTAGYPVVFGTVRSRRPDAKTLIVYGLYDMTPTIEDEWAVDPLGAEIVESAKIGLDPAIGPVIVSRAAHNHRGPTLGALFAIQRMLRVEGDVPCNLIFVIEGEEEIGSPNLPAFVEENRELLAGADGAWLPCMYQSGDSMFTLRGFKGGLWTELRCDGGAWGGTVDGNHLWAGHSAWIDAPMIQVVRALASLIDADNKLVVDGAENLTFDLNAEDLKDARELVAQVRADPSVEAAMLRTLGVARMRGGASLDQLFEQFMFGLNANIQGISGGYEGESFYSMLPGRAGAKIDIRFPKGTDHTKIAELIRAHLDRRGFENVRLVGSRGYPAARTARTDPLLTSATDAAAEYGVTTEVWPMYNGCCPASLFQSLGEIPFSFAGLGEGERPHAPNEFIRLDAIGRLMHFTVSYLHAWAAA